MNITLSADKKLIEKSRSYANKHKTSLNQLIRGYMEQLTGDVDRQKSAEEFAELAKKHSGESTPEFKFSREDLYNDRTKV